MKIEAPRVSLRNGQHYAELFDDVYCDAGDGLSETRHVFIDGSGFQERCRAAACTTVGETGFGTGLNFCAAWCAFEEHARPDACLRYASIEKYPLSREQLAQSLGQWPALQHYSEQLLQQYPPRRAGMHRLEFDGGRIQLFVCFGDVASWLPLWQWTCDCWFLDGFAPQRNQAMWSPQVLQEIARCSHTGTTLSTFTAAGFVRRGLQDAGFQVEKIPGFGRKREMLRAVFQGAQQQHDPAFALPPCRTGMKHVAVIGAGIAGCTAAWACARAGHRVTVFDPSGLAQGASGNALGIAGPCLAADNSPFARYYFNAWRQSLQVIARLEREQGTELMQVCGTRHRLLHAAARERALRLVEQHAALDPWCCMENDALCIPEAALLRPAALCAAFLGDCALHTVAVQQLEHQHDRWQLHDTAGQCWGADAVIIANAQAALQFEQCRALQLQSVRGQLVCVQQPQAVDSIVQATAYLTPAWQGQQLLGATFQRDDDETALRQADQDALLQAAADELGMQLPAQELLGRVSSRSCGPDRMPLIGPLIDADAFTRQFADLRHGRPDERYAAAAYLPDCYVSLGHGSRGLIGSLPAALAIADCISGRGLLLERDLWQAVAPQRFVYRALRSSDSAVIQPM